MSILIRKSLPLCLLALEVDPGGRYVIIHATIMNLEVVIVGLYVPPPASISFLYQLVSKLSQCATDNILLLGHFNMIPDPGMDRLSQTSSSATELKV